MTRIEKIWSELFRPTSLDEIIGQNNIISRIKHFIGADEYPNMIFTGPNGVGKTTCAKILMNSIFTPEEQKKHVLWINGADDRGPHMARETVKKFCRKGMSSRKNIQFIIIENIGQVTHNTQRMIPYMLENYNKHNRFIFTCTYKSKVLNHIKTHCMEFTFRPLKEEEIITKLKSVAELKDLSIDDESYIALSKVSHGDMRRALIFLQSAVAISNSTNITADLINEISNHIKRDEVEDLLLACFQKDRDISNVKTNLSAIIDKYGFLGDELIREFYYTLNQEKNDVITSEQRFIALSLLADAEYRIFSGCNPVIQLTGFLSKLLTT